MAGFPRDKFEKMIFKGLPFTMSVLGCLLLLASHYLWKGGIMPVVPGIFSESVNVPVNFYSIGAEVFALEMDNFLIFQNFQSLAPPIFPQLSLAYGLLIWVLFLLGLTLISTFKRMYFIIAAALCIFLFTFSGVTGLHIGGLYSNTSLLILLAGTLLPLILLSFFAPAWGLLQRLALVLISGTLTLVALLQLSDIQNPALWLAENSIFPAALIALLFFMHIGHAVISSITVFLIRLNKGTGIKIIWQLVVIFLLFFLLLIFTLLSIMGAVSLPFPTLPPFILFLLAGFLGYGVMKLKAEQTDQVYELPLVGRAFYWLGFAIAGLTWAKADFTGNQPLFEFLNHSFIYGQLALSLLFFLYLLANFSQVINTGREVEKILFKPQFFAYFHMRIGATMALVILVIFADAVVGVQLGAFSTQATADYYYQNQKPLEAAILYESSWLEYRNNPKAKSAAAHLRFQLGNTTEAMDHLYQNFDYVPSVPNILLLSDRLHRQEKIFEALFYLEKGLEIFPEDARLKNNLSLLYSKLNRPNEAMQLLQDMNEKKSIAKANLLALMVKHRIGMQEGIDEREDLPYRINYLAHANRQGNFAPFVLDTRDLPDNFHLQTAVLRNQWSNKVGQDITGDLLQMDSLIALEQMSFEERNYRETRILRTLQGNFLNETLKFLNGMVQAYPNSAGYYHITAAKILAGNWDLEKASVDILMAGEKGFENYQPLHLALLYFGGKPVDALRVHTLQEVEFPRWMEWAEDGRLIENEQVQFWTFVGQMHSMLQEELLAPIEKLDSEILKSEWAMGLLRHKLHAISQEDFGQVKNLLLEENRSGWTAGQLDNWYDYVHGKTDSLLPEIDELLQTELGRTRNAYWSPMIWRALEEEPEILVKYEILQEAIQFNKDPLLWILYVKYSRQMGLDNYASEALASMQGWLDSDQIERLQMENF
jgi:tetratricopeptide (TPR) repeat protein